ncbi:D-glycero-alpha-D-manno-heptose-1,7-bisphosphate 7-phosphatase [Fulvitalea axinellae]|uniref:D,D-heptose 1,7-bisphosphate phosphatase n=1 Tax=Fulvitalea axinellae TaxID=1182444 RepID=A0AAU9D3C9_9BACT|nr:D-glycero-alpha-D-manno-heptose-1,7-bisphosphate 7-phosphatase [Fulvitalea axinellae]
MKNKCVFLDRDGVLNVERGEYTYKTDDFIIPEGVKEALENLKKAGYLLIVITNQAGIAKGIYTKNDVLACHSKLQNETSELIDDIFYCPHHPIKTESLARKPESLMFERAIAKYDIDASQSWMVGDSERDLVPCKKLGIKTIRVYREEGTETIGDHLVPSLFEASKIILK